ncbi:hypothetical protein HPB48_015536 [Haemaphysalis longicornis]|uniref:Uncharacterized protein n=1 Tax=Haemaphysalis longicornis TaxID=44386 RepID=A0A9J6F8N1_HAELO|nr:hypothetical protein HPB48_015536 [Haemaphysalis longicornis]
MLLFFTCTVNPAWNYQKHGMIGKHGAQARQYTEVALMHMARGWQSAQNVRASLAARSAAGAVVRQGESFHFAPVLHCRAGEASDGEEGRLGEGRSTCEPRGRRRRQGGLALLVQDLRSHFWGGEGASFGKQDAQVISVSGATATPGGFCISPAGSSRAAVVAEARRSGASSALRSPLRLNAAASRMFRCRRYPVSALVDWVEWRRKEARDAGI